MRCCRAPALLGLCPVIPCSASDKSNFLARWRNHGLCGLDGAKGFSHKCLIARAKTCEAQLYTHQVSCTHISFLAIEYIEYAGNSPNRPACPERRGHGRAGKDGPHKRHAPTDPTPSQDSARGSADSLLPAKFPAGAFCPHHPTTLAWTPKTARPSPSQTRHVPQIRPLLHEQRHHSSACQLRHKTHALDCWRSKYRQRSTLDPTTHVAPSGRCCVGAQP